MSSKQGPGEDGRALTQVRTRQKLQRPRLYKVIFHNDDYTPREFVVLLLQGVFHMGEAEAQATMLHIHNTGLGVVGIYPHEIAETKVTEVMVSAEKQQFPLLCTMEPEEGNAPEPSSI